MRKEKITCESENEKIVQNEKTENQKKRGRPKYTPEQAAEAKIQKKEKKEKELEEREEALNEIGMSRKQVIRATDLTGDKLATIVERYVRKRLPTAPPRGNNPALDQYDISKEIISDIYTQSLYWFNRPLVRTPEECADRLNEYFRRIVETGEIATVERLALVVGGSVETLEGWINGTIPCNPGVLSMVIKAMSIVRDMDASLAQKGEIPTAVWIFRAKNYWGMKDVVETVVHNAPSVQEMSESEIDARYANYGAAPIVQDANTEG